MTKTQEKILQAYEDSYRRAVYLGSTKNVEQYEREIIRLDAYLECCKYAKIPNTEIAQARYRAVMDNME